MTPTSLPAATVVTPASTPPPHLSAAPAPVSVRAKGSGELRLAHRYPLGDLVYTADPSGRGMLTFRMGRSLLVLSGGDADQVAPDRYVLHLDVMQVNAMVRAQGDCNLTLSSDGRIYRALACSGQVPATGEAFRLTWRGADIAAEPLR